MVFCVFSVLASLPLFQTERSGSIPTKALLFEQITSKRAQKLNALWHRTLPKIGAVNTMKVCYGAKANGNYYAIAMWSNPVARMLCQQTWLELRRFAIADDAPKNTATRMLAWMERDIRRRFPIMERLVSYQDAEEHTGTIYRAMGNWLPVELNKTGGAWSNRQRWNRTAKRLGKKVRWERPL